MGKKCASREIRNEIKQFDQFTLGQTKLVSTVVNRTLPCLHEGSLEFTLTVPLTVQIQVVCREGQLILRLQFL